MFAGDDEFTALAVDMAQYGFGRGHAVEADLAFGQWMFMADSPCPVRDKVGPLDRLINLDYINQYEKIRRPLPLRPRGLGRARDLAATLYAYVSRGLIRSEPSPESRSHRYRAEDVRGLKERRAPSPEPRGFRSFDADLPVMDSAIATITEQGAIYRGVNCVDLAEKDTLEHTATLLWDVTGVDPFAGDNCPEVSDAMRAIADAARRAAPIDRAIAVLALASSADPHAFTRAPMAAPWSGRASSG